MFSKFERNREKATMACFKVLSRYSPRGTSGDRDNPVRVKGNPAQIRTHYLPNNDEPTRDTQTTSSPLP